MLNYSCLGNFFLKEINVLLCMQNYESRKRFVADYKNAFCLKFFLCISYVTVFFSYYKRIVICNKICKGKVTIK